MENPKRLRSSEDESKLKRCSQDESKVDRISLLADELLVSILCLLSFKEATATSILSRRWRYLRTWTHKLDFDGTESIIKLMYTRDKTQEHLDDIRCNYIKWVHHIIANHNSPILEEFRLVFNLDRSNSRIIAEWLRFALSRKVEKLELNLTDDGIRTRDYHEDYIFPYRHYVKEFKLLKKLSTNHVNVSGEFVKELLGNCPLLEHIALAQSNLQSLEIINTFPSFKVLEISLCHDLESLVIRDSSIVTLKVYTGTRIEHVVLENVPLLTEFWSWPDTTCVSMRGLHRMFSAVLQQLRLLKIYILDHELKHKDMRKFCSSVVLSNLKQLVVVDSGGRRSCLPHLIELINASPQLERFVLESPEYFSPAYIAVNFGGNQLSKMEITPSEGVEIGKKYPHLKEMKIIGYRGLWHQLEMVLHFVKEGAALQNIVVDPRPFTFQIDHWWDYVPQQTANQELLDMAHQLRKYVPPRINLHIL